MSNVLYIDNNLDESRFWESQLQDLGYEVQLAQTAIDALGMIRQTSYALIILKQDLPEYTGVDMLRSLADEAGTAPIIMVAERSDPQVAHIAYELGISHYIIKDADRHYVTQLPAAVRQTLEQRRLIEALAAEKEKTQRLNRNLLLMNRLGQLLTSSLTMQEVTDQFVTTVSDLFQSEGTTVWLFDERTSSETKGILLCVSAFTSGNLVDTKKLNLSLDKGIAGWVAEHNQSVYVPDVEVDERFSPASDENLNFVTKSILAVPLKTQTKTLGVLQLVNLNTLAYGEETQSLIETIAASASIAIENARLIEQLREQNDELEQQNSDLDAYTGTVAHDLKNPITHFLSYADELREHHRLMSDQEIDNYLDIILLQSRRMNTIVDELLLLARVRMTKQIQVDELDMETIMLDVLDRLELDIRETKAQIDIPDEWHNAYGYVPWVEGVWYNYLTNGLKYGGDPPKLSFGSQLGANDMVWYWIEDNGIGLSTEEQEKLFQPFPVINRPGIRGNGLGLVIVKRIVERLNGEVAVESEVGKGSRFYFSLPHTLTHATLLDSENSEIEDSAEISL